MAMTFKKGIKRYLARIQTAYHTGMIPYPRVDNDFVTDAPYQTFPHPPLPRIAPEFEPIGRKIVEKLNKKSSILFLSAARIVTPAGIDSAVEFIDAYFDDELRLLEEKREQAERLMDVLRKFYEETGMGDKKCLDLKKQVYQKMLDTGKTGELYHQGRIRFFPQGSSQRLRMGQITRWKHSLSGDPGNISIKAEGISDAIEQYEGVLELSRSKRYDAGKDKVPDKGVRLG
jgi:hypothetical protein